MYENFFDDKRQSIMRDYFLNDLSKLGSNKIYKKGELIDINLENYVAIVVKGVVSQCVLSAKGHEKLLYLIRPGEIFGEMSYFCGGPDSIMTRAKETTKVCILNEETLEGILKTNPEVYRHFIHSITRKYRIVMLQLTNSIFNDAMGKIADALLRLHSCEDADAKKSTCINMPFTHQELANNIGCSRITVTRCLNKFLAEKIISYDHKKIIIHAPEALRKYIDIIVED